MAQIIDETRDMLRTIRRIQEDMEYTTTSTEGPSNFTSTSTSDSKTGGAIAITDDPKFGQQVLTNQENDFKSSVDGGVEFAAANSNSPENSPLIYFPDNGNLVFSGKIRNIKWQFSLKDNSGNGCFVWTNGLQLTPENLQTLSKLQGFYLIWKAQWEKEGKLLDMMGKNHQ